MEIRPATEVDAPALSELALRAKAHWGYPAEVLESWRAELTVSTHDIAARPTFVAMSGWKIAGFYVLMLSRDSWELEHFWVSPDFMGQGIGRELLEHALETASRAGARSLNVDADPNAESFYLKCGAIRRGERAAPIPGQPDRVRPQLAFQRLPRCL